MHDRGLRPEALPGAHVWWRVADPSWSDPLDPDFARRRGGRWNAPGSFRVLYLNEDLATARLNLRAFIAGWPYEPEDLRDDTGPVLIGCTLPRRQIVCDAHSPAGLRAAGLPATYPLDETRRAGPARALPAGRRAREGRAVARRPRPLRAVPGTVQAASWRGSRATGRSTARRERTLSFAAWFRGLTDLRWCENGQSAGALRPRRLA